jgi:hypothetical protein
MSALGQDRTFPWVQAMSPILPKADIDQHGRDVRFVPKADIRSATNHPIWPIPQDSSFPLDLNGRSVAVGCAGKDHEVAPRGLVFAAHQIAYKTTTFVVPVFIGGPADSSSSISVHGFSTAACVRYTLLVTRDC